MSFTTARKHFYPCTRQQRVFIRTVDSWAHSSRLSRERMLERVMRATVSVQVFGTKKCADSRKAERFFSERGTKVHVVDLAEKGMSAGELRNVAGRVGGMDALIDRAGKRYIAKGLKYAAPTGSRVETMLVEDPLLLRTPIVRCEGRATVGYAPEIWQSWIDGEG